MIHNSNRPHMAVVGLALAIVSLSGSLAIAAPHPFNARDLVTLDRISDPQVAPDGDRVVFVRRSTDLEDDRGRLDLWLMDMDGGDLRQLTVHEANDSHPRWQPDGEALYFLSSRSGSSQVWRIPNDGGEARAVTDLPLDVGNLVISPDGNYLAFSLEVFPDCGDLECTTARLAENESTAVTGVEAFGGFRLEARAG